MLEAGPIALAVRGTPIVSTYQCDVTLPGGVLASTIHVSYCLLYTSRCV